MTGILQTFLFFVPLVKIFHFINKFYHFCLFTQNESFRIGDLALVFLFVVVYGRLNYMEKLNKNISFYSIIIETCEEGGYFAYCPTLQGCHAEGETYGEVIDNTREVIEAHLELRKKHKELVSFVKIKNMSDMNIQIPVPVRN